MCKVYLCPCMGTKYQNIQLSQFYTKLLMDTFYKHQTNCQLRFENNTSASISHQHIPWHASAITTAVDSTALTHTIYKFKHNRTNILLCILGVDKQIICLIIGMLYLNKCSIFQFSSAPPHYHTLGILVVWTH